MFSLHLFSVWPAQPLLRRHCFSAIPQAPVGAAVRLVPVLPGPGDPPCGLFIRNEIQTQSTPHTPRRKRETLVKKFMGLLSSAAKRLIKRGTAVVGPAVCSRFTRSFVPAQGSPSP